MKKQLLSLTLGGAVVATLIAAPIARAEENPFAMEPVAGMLTAAADAKKPEAKKPEHKKPEAKKTDGKCAEGKCGDMAKTEAAKKDGGTSTAPAPAPVAKKKAAHAAKPAAGFKQVP
jgi:uncharacterized low-complexity protein